MNTLSVIVLTHNDEEIIADCLESLKGLGNELLIIDSESEDRTPQIAEHLGAKVIKHYFKDFSDQRNFAMSKASGNWVLYLDSDEQVNSQFKKEVLKIIQEENQTHAGFFIKRDTYYFGKKWGLTDKVQRLFNKPKFIEWFGVVHETPKIKGTFGVIDTPVSHFTHRNLSQMISKTNEWSQYEAELRINAHHPPMNILRFIRVIITGFLGSYIKGKGYKNGTAGIVESLYQGFSMFITYAKLWEMQKKK